MEQTVHWQGPGLTRVPFDVYTDTALAQQEQERIFRGATWNYLCLEAELPEGGSYRSTFVGETPVVVVKDGDGEIYAFETRCAHRGALIELGSGRDVGEGGVVDMKKGTVFGGKNEVGITIPELLKREAKL